MHPPIIQTSEFEEGLKAFFAFCHPGNVGKVMNDVIQKLEKMRTSDDPIILSFKRKDSDPDLMKLQHHGLYSYDPITVDGYGTRFIGGTFRVSLLEALTRNPRAPWKIQSIIYNGNRFQIGDMIDDDTIVFFKMPTPHDPVVREVLLQHKNGESSVVSINRLFGKVPRRYAFTDSLGKRIFTGDYIFAVNAQSNYSYNKFIMRENTSIRNHLLYFLLEDDAKTFISQNRKVLSVSDVKELRQQIPNKIGKGLEEALIKLAKTRI